MHFSVKATGFAIATGLLGQQIQCPWAVPAEVADIIVPQLTSELGKAVGTVGSAAASFGGAIAGAHFAGNHQRRDGLVQVKRAGLLDRAFEERSAAPAGVNQYNWDMCMNSMKNDGASIILSGPVSDHGIQVTGLPATCMVLAGALDGSTTGGPVPTPCGSACILWNGLAETEYNTLKDGLNSLLAI